MLDLTEAFKVFDQFEEELRQRKNFGSDVHEQFIMAKARLCYTYTTKSKLVNVSLLRQVFADGVQHFPRNTAFLSLYAWNEGRTYIENRVRAMLQDNVLVDGKENVLSWTFAIWAEIQMGVGRRVNVGAVRSLFERALECER